MRKRRIILAVLVGCALPMLTGAQEVVDRIVVRIEQDILTLSEVRELVRFQQLVEGRAVDEERALEQLIEQWIVKSEADAARFPRPAEARIENDVAQLRGRFSSPEAWRARLAELGLSEAAVKCLLERQLLLARYLDYKFRPAAQVEAEEVERYYRETLLPQLLARGQPAPPLADVEEQIREVLTQREISERAARWLDETRQRLRIERLGMRNRP